MPTIVDGNSLGLAGSTMNTLGVPPGTAAVGRSGESLYVNAATGNLILQRQDELLLGRGPDIAALRTYNSQGATDGDDNDNWRIGFYRQLTALTGTVNKSGSTITRVDADGAELLYHYDSERGRYLCEQGAGAYDTLRYDAVTRLWLWADGASERSETYQWNAAASGRQLISERDADGNALQYSYDSRGLLSRVTSAGSEAGRLNQTELIYEAGSARTCNLLRIQSSAWDAASNSNRILTRVRYAYDACERLSMVSVDLSPQDNSIADGNTYVTRYTYDGDSQRIASLAQTDGTLLRFDYVCVDGDYRVASVVNALGQITRYQYDTQKRTTTVIDPSGFKTRHDYDSAGRLIRLTAPAVDGVSQVQQFRYNERGDLTQRVDAKGQVTDIAYDRNGNQVLQRDAAGNTITRYYGTENQLLAETVYAVPDTDGAGPARPSAAQTTHYVYAAAQSRQLRFIVSPEGRVTEYRYNAAGERISQIQYTRDLADTRDWLLAFPAALPAPQPCDDDTPAGPVYQGGYVAAAPNEAMLAAWVAGIDRSHSLRTDLAYDFRGQLQQETTYGRVDALGAGVADGSEDRRSFIYSPAGELLQSVSGSGGVAHYVYDGLGRLLASTDALGNLTLNQFDDAGNRSTTQAANGLRTTLVYDAAGRLVSTVQSDANAAQLRQASYFYDNSGRLRYMQDSTGVKQWMVYDDAGRKTADIDGNGSLTEYLYDANNQLTQTIQYATPVASLWSPVLDAEIFDYSERSKSSYGTAADPAYTSLAALGLSDRTAGSMLNRVAQFQTSTDGIENAQYLAATRDLDTFAMRLTGSITVFKAGDFTFYTRSDDGSQLFVDGRLAIDNDGLHMARTHSVTLHLEAGEHRVVETFFERSGAQVNAFGPGVQTSVFATGIELDGSAARQFTVTVPALPTGAAVRSTELQLVDAVALGKSWLSDIKLSVAGAVTLGKTALSDKDQPGPLQPGRYSVTLPNLPTAGGRVTLTLSDSYNDQGIDARIAQALLIVTWSMDELSALRPAASAQDRKTWRVFDAAGRVVKTISETGAVTQTDYDGAGRVLRSTAYATPVDTAALGVTQVQPAASLDDRVTRYFHDQDGLLRGVLDGEGYLSEFVLDAARERITRIRYATLTPMALRAAGRLDQLRPAASANDQYAHTLFDARGAVIAEVDAENYLTVYRYDHDGNRILSLRYQRRIDPVQLGSALDGEGTLALIRPASDSEDQASRWQYDLLGRLVLETDAQGSVTSHRYDSVGNRIATTRAAASDEARTRTQRYDLQGRLIAELDGEGSLALAALANPDPAATEQVWASYGIRYRHDAEGRRISALDANGSRSLYFYNEDNQLLYTVNALGEVEGRRYNALNQLISVTRYASRIGADRLATLAGGLLAFHAPELAPASPDDSRIDYSYHLDGTLASRRDALGNISRYDSNAFGEQQAMTSPVDGAQQLLQTMKYDRRGLLTQQTQQAQAVLQTRQEYDAFGRVVRTTDANGQVRQLAYDRLGRQIQSINAVGAAHLTSYDALDRVLTQTDALGGVTRMVYDTAQRLVRLTTPEGVTIITTSNRHGQTQRVTDGNGQTTVYRYDRNGNLVESAQPLSTTRQAYDHGNRLIETTDGNGTRTVLGYDAANRVLTRTVDPQGLNLRTAYRYDAQARQVAMTDANGVVTSYRYDLNGQLLEQVIDPDGLKLTTRRLYDAAGRTVRVTDPNGVPALYVFDAFGRRIAQSIDPDGLNLTTRYAYDSNSNVVARIDANGHVTRYVYDAENRLRYQIDANGAVTENRYDLENRVIQSTRYARALAPATASSAIASSLNVDPARDQVEHRLYDQDGRLRYRINGAGAVTHYQYDGNGNVIGQRSYARALDPLTMDQVRANPDGLIAVLRDDQHDQTTRTLYDAMNRAVFSINGIGAITQQAYDGNGNLVERIRYARTAPAAVVTLDALQQEIDAIADPSLDQRQRYQYDAANRLTWTVNGVGAVSRYQYDANGNRVRSIDYAQAIAAGQSPQAVQAQAGDRVSTTIVDAANRAILQINALGAVTQQLVDANGNVVQRISYATALTEAQRSQDASLLTPGAILSTLTADPTQDRTLRTTYDAANRAVYAVDAGGAVTHTEYDALGQVLGIRRHAHTVDPHDPNGLAALQAGSDDRVERRQYDAVGQLVYQVDALGHVTHYQYDSFGQLTRRTEYARPIDPELPAIAAQISIDAQQDRSTSTDYDQAGHVRSQTDALGQSESWTHDALGNKLGYTNQKGALWRYDYDAAQRLIQETSPAVALTTVVMGSDGNLRVDETRSANSALITRLEYDALDNLTQRIEAWGQPEQRSTRYEYDALGRQIRTVFPQVAVYAPAANGALDSAQRVEQTIAPTTQTRYDALGNALSSRDVNGNTRYKNYDLLGRVTYETDALGYVTAYRYNVWGEVTTLTRHALALAYPADGADAAAGLARSAQDRTLTQGYDQAGRLELIVESAADQYDADAAPGQQLFSAARTTRNSYNAFGELTESAQLKNPLSHDWLITRHDYDKRGRQIASVDALGYLTTRSYDGYGNLVEQTEHARALMSGANAAAPDPDDRTVRYTYDRNDRKISQTQVGVLYHDATTGSEGQRGDIVTTYGYDAVGNLTRSTDAYGASSYSFYDALGRVSAVLAPTRASTINNQSLTPVTLLRRNAHGDVLVQTESARGAINVSASGYTLAGSSADDRSTLTLYDSHGHAVQSSDAMGVNHYAIYNADGQLARTWQLVTGADGSSLATLWKVQQYDAAGQLIRQREAFNAQTVIDTGMRYNAFGEMTARGTQGGWQEYFDYDNTGRLWRTNQKDGVDKIALHDLQGNATADLRSNGQSDLSQVQSASEAGARSDLRRVDIQYDRLGRVVRRIDVQQGTAGPAIDGNGRWQTALDGYVHADGQDGWTVLPRLDAGTLSLSGLAAGSYAYELRQDDGRVLDQGQLGIQDGQAARAVAAVGLPKIDQLRLQAKLVGGIASLDDAADYIVWGNPGDAAQQRFAYRPAGSQAAWTDAPVIARGNGYSGIDRRGVAPGAYEYRLSLYQGGSERTVEGSLQLGGAKTGILLKLLDDQGQHVAAVPAMVIQWPRPPSDLTPQFQYRLHAGDTWNTLAVEEEIAGVNTAGEPVGFQQVRLDSALLPALEAGQQAEYQLVLSQNGQPARHATGRISRTASGSLQLSDTTPPYEAAYSIAATGRQYQLSNLQRPVTVQTLDRWGNVLRANDPRNLAWQTEYRYNARDQIIEERKPGDALTLYRYDKAGRQVGTVDANGNAQLLQYDMAGQLMLERHADGGVIQHSYNAFGERVRRINELGQSTQYRYDKLGHLIQVQHPTTAVYTASAANTLRFVGYRSLTDSYRYDQAGRRIASTNGNNETTQLRYDLHGNLVEVIQPMGLSTRYGYDAQGRQTQMTDPNGNSALWQYDYFGQLQGHTDLGGAHYQYGYDAARQLTLQTNSRGQQLAYQYDLAGRLTRIDDLTLQQTTRYQYDAAGNRVAEQMSQAGVVYQDSVMTYNARNWLEQVSERSDGLVQVTIAYDAVGNRQRIQTQVATAQQNSTEDRWFAYDLLNRQTVVDAIDADGDLAQQGRRISYDLAGNRVMETVLGQRVEMGDDGRYTSTAGESTRLYRYDAQNQLVSTEVDGMEVEKRYYDGAGRVVQQGVYGLDQDYIDALNTDVYERDRIGENISINRYDANGQLLYQRVLNPDGSAAHDVDYSHTYDAAGNLLHYAVISYGENGSTSEYSNSYVRYEGYVISGTEASSSVNEPGRNTRLYDVNGNLTGIRDATKAANDRVYINNSRGQILYARQDGHVQRQLIVNDEVLGRYGVAVDRVKARNDEGDLQYSTLADLDFSYANITGQHPAATPTPYRAQPGDTLQAIARKLYGDSSYWYLIADANGLDAQSQLDSGQPLNLPGAVLTRHNQQDSFKVYNSADIIGELSPNLPPPPQDDGGCGLIATILVIVVAVVATVFTAGVLAAPAGTLATSGLGAVFSAGSAALAGGSIGISVVAGAVGSIASQLTGMALGVQDGFSWKGVALGAVSAGVTAGVGATFTTGFLSGTGAAATAARAMIGNAITQGIGVATGLQDKFSWTNVAAAGVGAAVGSVVGEQLKSTEFFDVKKFGETGEFGNRLVRGTLSGLASGAAVAVLHGGRMNITQIATDAFGNALGNSLVESVKAPDVMPVQEVVKGITSTKGAIDAPEWWPTVDLSLEVDDQFKSHTVDGQDVPPTDNTPQTGVVGKEGRRGAWGIAESLAESGASNAEINRIKNQLLQLNPELVSGIKQGQTYFLPNNDTAENNALARAADQNYATQRYAASNRDSSQSTAQTNSDSLRTDATKIILDVPVNKADQDALQTPSISSKLSTYDKVSLGAHTALGVAGAVPLLGAIPDAIDLLYTGAEYLIGKSTKTDLGLAALALGANIIPVGVDQAADAAKIANRTARLTDTLIAAEKATVKEVALTTDQLKNVERFTQKLPVNAKENLTLKTLPNEGVAVRAVSPGRVPGSFAVYEKQIDAAGKTIQYTKTTYDPAGNIVHVKDKINGGVFP